MHGFTSQPATDAALRNSASIAANGLSGVAAAASGAAERTPGQTPHAVVIGAGAVADQAAQLLSRVDGTVSVCPSVQAALIGHANGVDRVSSGAAGARVNALVVLAGPLGEFVRHGVIDEVRKWVPTSKIVAFATAASVGDAVSAMRSGVMNVLQQDQPTEALAESLQEAFAAGVKGARRAAQAHVLKDRLSTLTAAEDSVLDEMLAGMANKQIAQKLEIGLRTVELRRSKIMRKMQAKSLSELVKFICIARGIADLDAV